MKKLTTAKIWQFAAGQFGWALLSGIISNWLVYFYQPDETAISQGQTIFIPQGLVIFGAFTIIGGIRRPFFEVHRSDQDAIIGSVNASKILPKAVIPPMMVKAPKITSPCGMNIVCPWLIAVSSG